ncbi:hypothetical protein PMAYCL1PPCAC_03066, partial [Pristionchus mayeri]
PPLTPSPSQLQRFMNRSLFLICLVQSAPWDEFKAARCRKEMICLVPGRCLGVGAGDSKPVGVLEFFDGTKGQIEECDGVVGIRPYSEHKWLVVMRQKGPEQKMMQLLKKEGKEDKLIFECKPTGGEDAAITVSTELVKGVEHVKLANHSVVQCEFELSFPNEESTEFIPHSNSKFVALEVGGVRWQMKAKDLSTRIGNYKGCNPDLIKFNNTNDEEEKYEQVDARRFAVACK